MELWGQDRSQLYFLVGCRFYDHRILISRSHTRRAARLPSSVPNMMNTVSTCSVRQLNDFQICRGIRCDKQSWCDIMLRFQLVLSNDMRSRGTWRRPYEKRSNSREQEGEEKSRRQLSWMKRNPDLSINLLSSPVGRCWERLQQGTGQRNKKARGIKKTRRINLMTDHHIIYSALPATLSKSLFLFFSPLHTNHLGSGVEVTH